MINNNSNSKSFMHEKLLLKNKILNKVLKTPI